MGTMSIEIDGHGKEAKLLVRAITLYKSLRLDQIYRLFPHKKQDSINNLVVRLHKAQRLVINTDINIVSASEDTAELPDYEMIAAFWVLLDFLDRVDYHVAGEYPVKISFFCTDGDGDYEIVYVAPGNEMMISRALSMLKSNGSQRIIVVNDTKQIPSIHVPDVAAFCTVSHNGNVSYYKLSVQEEDNGPKNNL